jgi:hypothetical protein
MAIITWTHNSFHHALTECCGAVSLIVDMLTVSSRTRALDIAWPALELEQACGALEKLPSKHAAMLQESGSIDRELAADG